KSLRRSIKEEQIESSFLGSVGRSLEPVTQWAGFDWKINVAILSSFAARESSVATIGVLYQQGADENKSLEERMAAETTGGGFSPLHALAVMVFFALYPPCLATTIMIKVQTGSYKWMVFSILFPTTLGFIVASAIFTGGNALNLNGIQMMGVFYVFVVALTIVTGLSKGWTKQT
ncbi:MAG TPA: ferrous iron transport protein B, partial [Desulfocapsa sulfexigens]|nr:ferrous iron transport protein B [Desulfocapsa sulfexigens]